MMVSPKMMILSCPMSGCARATVLGTLPEGALHVTVEGSNLYVATKHQILVVPKDGSAPVRVIADAELPYAADAAPPMPPGSSFDLDAVPLAFYGDQIFWGDKNGEVAHCPVSGCRGAPSVL